MELVMIKQLMHWQHTEINLRKITISRNDIVNNIVNKNVNYYILNYYIQ